MKKLRKIMSILLTISIISTTGLSISFASDSVSDEQLKNKKDYAIGIFKSIGNKNGIETRSGDTIIKSDGYTLTLNKQTGDITHTYFTEDGKVKNEYTTNFYENLEKSMEMETKNIQRASYGFPAWGGDKLIANTTGSKYDKLKYDIRRTHGDTVTVYVQQYQNKKNKYYNKYLYNYDTGYTKVYVDSVDKARSAHYKMYIEPIYHAFMAIFNLSKEPLNVSNVMDVLGLPKKMAEAITKNYNSYRLNVYKANYAYYGKTYTGK